MKLNISLTFQIKIAILMAFVACLTSAGIVRAQMEDDTAKRPTGRRGFIGAPYVEYSPETEWVGGAVGFYYFDLSSDSTLRTRPSDLSGGGSYSQKHQSTFGINYDLYFPGNAYYLTGGFHYQQFPLYYFGDGDRTPANNIDTYTPLYRGLTFEFMKNWHQSRYGNGLNAGIEGEFRNDHILQSDTGGLIATNQVPGAKGGVSNGLGAIVLYDTRDNAFSTLAGQYESVDWEFYGHALGSDFSFNRFRADLRKFYPLAKDQTLALQFYGVLENGTVPFYEMPGLGGNTYERGYYLLRFRENDVLLGQAEWRFPIWWRFGGVVFADAGEVGHTLSNFSLPGIHPSYGAGLRLLVIKNEHITARLDYGIGTDSKELYLAVLEAF